MNKVLPGGLLAAHGVCATDAVSVRNSLLEAFCDQY